jgi:glucose/mannose-6-phosphate isomerase
VTAAASGPAVDLDRAGALAEADPGGMLDALASAGDQARTAQLLAQEAPLLGPLPEQVVVGGMGGSGVAGDVLAALAFPVSPVPVVPVKGDRLPAFVGPGTLLIAVSYSGGTGETLAAVEQALAAGTRLVVVASGGRLAELAERRGAPAVLVPGGRMPRAALWSLVVPVLLVAEAVGVLPPLGDQVPVAADLLDEQAKALGPDVPVAENPAKLAALRLLGKLPVAWGSGQLGAVAATRLRTQCNENAKVTVASAALPEANHNDVMGLEPALGAGGSGGSVSAPPEELRRELVLLRDVGGEHERDARRIDAALAALGVADPIVRLAGDGPPLARLARLVAFADFASTYLAFARGVDPTPVRTIDLVKAALAGGGPAGAAPPR